MGRLTFGFPQTISIASDFLNRGRNRKEMSQHDADLAVLLCKIRERPPGCGVDQSCADCPVFPGPGCGDARPPELHPGASEPLA